MVRLLLLIGIGGLLAWGALRPMQRRSDIAAARELDGHLAVEEFIAAPRVRELSLDSWLEEISNLQEEGVSCPEQALLRARTETNRSVAAGLLFLARSMGASRGQLSAFLSDPDPDVVTAAALAMTTPPEFLDLTLLPEPTSRRRRASAWVGLFEDCGMWTHSTSERDPLVDYRCWGGIRMIWREPIEIWFAAEYESPTRAAEWDQIRSALLRVRSSAVFQLCRRSLASPDFLAMATAVVNDPSETEDRRIQAVDALHHIGSEKKLSMLEALLSTEGQRGVADAIFGSVEWLPREREEAFLDQKIETGSAEFRRWAIARRVRMEAEKTDLRAAEKTGLRLAVERSLARAFLRMLEGRLSTRPFTISDRAWLSEAMLDSPAVAHKAIEIVVGAQAIEEFRDALSAAEREGSTNVVRDRARRMLDRLK